MDELEIRALRALHRAFCKIRSVARHQLSEDRREYLVMIADAAHNIPDALSMNAYESETLEHDLLALEDVMSEQKKSMNCH